MLCRSSENLNLAAVFRGKKNLSQKQKDEFSNWN